MKAVYYKEDNMKKLFALFIMITVSISGCNAKSAEATDTLSTEGETYCASSENTTEIKESENNMININVNINGVDLKAELYDNEAVSKFVESLPVTYNMSDLHGNEKYYYMDSSLPVKSERPSTINEGDIMLFGSDCLVVFYDTFNNSYSYTRLGRIVDTKGLKEAVGEGNVNIRFELR